MPMIRNPRGFNRSVSQHNIDFEAFLDWLEATAIFLGEELSQTDVVDYLVEEHLYDDQNFASTFVSFGWTEVERRLSWLGSFSPIRFYDRWMVREAEWTHIPAHSFCLAVSFGPKCDGWTGEFGNDYTEQGRLFELITKSAIEARFQGWELVHTGWSRENALKLPDVVDNLVLAIDERVGDLAQYASRDANEAGLDLVWHLPFADSRGGGPVYLAQCASGLNWPDKVSEPNLSEWRKIVDFAAVPNKAFSLPFALDERELRRQSNRSGGLLLDRYRLLAHGRPESDWIPGDLSNDLIAWLEPRIDWIIDR